MRRGRHGLITVVVAGLVGWVSSSLAQSVTATATWEDKADNEQGTRVIQIVPNVTPRPVMCDVGANVVTCTFPLADTSRRCYVAVAYNADGPSPDSIKACTGTPSTPGAFRIVTTVTTTIAAPEPPHIEIE